MAKPIHKRIRQLRIDANGQEEGMVG